MKARNDFQPDNSLNISSMFPNTKGAKVDNQLGGEDNYTQNCDKFLARFCWERGKDPEKPPFTSPMAIRS